MGDYIKIEYLFDRDLSENTRTDVLTFCENRDRHQNQSSDDETDLEVPSRDPLGIEGTYTFDEGDFTYDVALGTDAGVFGAVSSIELKIDEIHFITDRDGDPTDVLRAGAHLYDLVADLYEYLVDAGHDVRYVCGLSPGDDDRVQMSGTAFSLERVEEGSIDDLFWLQILPPNVVDAVGRELLMTAPAWRVRELADGAIQFGVAEAPTFTLEYIPVYLTDELLDHLDIPEL